ncbi:MAG: GNAT family N-acetyltransferase [Lachnospiraceae bacterium]|nr:GNAT family N-acetyltransferase [Lachnospiraceae bacterium]
MIRREKLPAGEIVFTDEPELFARELSSGSCVITSLMLPGAAAYVGDAEDFGQLNDDYLQKVWDRFCGMGHVACEYEAAGEQWYIRELTGDDYEDWLRITADGGDGLFEGRPAGYARESAKKALSADGEKFETSRRIFADSMRESFAVFDMGTWGIFKKDTREMIGYLSLTPQEDGVGLGYCVMSSHRRRGLGAASCRALLEYAREELGARRFIIRCNTDNEASAGLARRLGFCEKEDKPGARRFIKTV